MPSFRLRALRMLLVWLLSLGCACSRSPVASTQQAARSADDAGLHDRLQAALHAKGPSYVPRTRHKNPDGSPKYTNRLILESSPYLLQHAHNPVNWFAWGEEAFERARTLGRPVFLSVGYSTCHWCHVMEEESFEDEAIARYLNEHYVAIKVDREQRPDIDSAYIAFVEAFMGSGGWPMNVWLTPAREPFFGGTYFPPRAGVRGAQQGLIELLTQQAQRFTADAAGVVNQAHHVVQQLKTASAPVAAGNFPSAALLPMAAASAAQRFDAAQGGSRGAPKFPSSFPNRMLLRVARRSADKELRAMVESTLQHMRAGGIYDQIGGGFHRYATDARWRVPHFEKMLYDNALLAVTYLEAAQATGDPSFAITTRETLDYLLRDMQAPDGTFYSATDADSPAANGEREEGVYFTWTPSELRRTLGEEDARVAQTWFGVTDHGDVEGRSVLHIERTASEIASELGLNPSTLRARLDSIRAKLLLARSTRPPPFRDEKVLVAGNGLALSAFARAAIVLGDPRYAAAAQRIGEKLTAALGGGHSLPHAFVQGRAEGQAFSDDYALLAAGLLDLFELTAQPIWLTHATALMEELEHSFLDAANGGYYLSAAQHESLLFRDKPDYDGPTPSVSSVAALTWLRLYAFCDDDRFRQRAEVTLRGFAKTLSERPLALDQMLLALDWASDASQEILILVPDHAGALSPSARPFLDLLAQHFAPNTVLLVATEADIDRELGQRVAWTQNKKLEAGRATAYVCERGACKLPTTDPPTFAAQLSPRPYP